MAANSFVRSQASTSRVAPLLLPPLFVIALLISLALPSAALAPPPIAPGSAPPSAPPVAVAADQPFLDEQALASQPGMRVVSAYVSLSNHQEAADLPYSPKDFAAVDVDEREYRDTVMPSGRPLGSGMLKPGEIVGGYVAWEVPRLAWPVGVSYRAPGLDFGMGVSYMGLVFTDVNAGYRFYPAIGRLKFMGLLAGFPDGYFYPGDPVLRQQMAKLVVLAFEKHDEHVAGSTPFADVTPALGSPYPFDFVGEAAEAGYFEGREGRFFPREPLSRLQLASVLGRAAGDDLPDPPADATSRFVDLPELSPEVAKTIYHGIMQGKDETHFDPWSPALRGQAAGALNRLLRKLVALPPEPEFGHTTSTLQGPGQQTSATTLVRNANPSTTITLP